MYLDITLISLGVINCLLNELLINL